MNFFVDMGHPPEGTSIDRLDNDLGYFKSNCRWGTEKQQKRNMRRCIFVKYKGESKTIGEWAELLNCNYHDIHFFVVKKKLTVAEAIKFPMRKHGDYSIGKPRMPKELWGKAKVKLCN